MHPLSSISGHQVTNIPDVKRYLCDVTIASDSLPIVKGSLPFQPPREQIVVHRGVRDGLFTCHTSQVQPPRSVPDEVVGNQIFLSLKPCHH